MANEENLPVGEVSENQEYGGARSAAVRVLSRFERSDAYLDKLLFNELSSNTLSPQDKALLTELVNGVIRWRWKLDWVLTGFYHGDYLKCLNIVKNALRTAIYQMLFLQRIPVYAIINETVEIIKRIQGEKTAGVVNGVLRNISRNLNNVRYPNHADDVVYYHTIMQSHPRWMIKRWVTRFGEEEAVRLLEANNSKPKVPVRINTLKTSASEITAEFDKLGLQYAQSKYIPSSFQIDSPGMDISSLDIFHEGKITIQDTASMLAAMLASPMPSTTVMDLCAAPGGKTFCLAEMMKNQGKLIAIDKYKSKLRFVTDGAKRLGYDIIEVTEGNAAEYEIEDPVDLVFADVPCSGLGTISKKPDIKWKREREDLFHLGETQRDIMANASRLLKVGGVFIYSTCSIEPEENEENVNWFLQEYTEFELDPAEKYLPAEVCSNGFLQTYPHIHGTDGMFAARMIKKS